MKKKSKLLYKPLVASRRYFFGSDGDGHNYLVPVDKREEFERWADEDTESVSFDPDGHPGTRIDGVNSYTFAFPREDSADRR